MAAGKRQATTDLNHDNWDRDEEPEEKGTFRTASSDELKKRVMKRARRNLHDKAEGVAEGAPKGAFSSFAGFGQPTDVCNTGAATASFSFLSTLTTTKPTVGTDNTITIPSKSSNNTSIPTFTSSSTSSGSNVKQTEPVEINNSISESAKFISKSETFCGKLKNLNEEVTAWIKMHVDRNPLCILTPIFKDYERFLRELEMEDNNTGSAASHPDSNIKPDNVASPPSALKFCATPISSTATSNATTANTKFLLGTAAASSPFVVSTTTTNGNTKKSSICGDKSANEKSLSSSGFNFGFKSSDKTDAGASPNTPISSGFSFVHSAATDAKKSPKTNFGSTANASPSSGFSFLHPAAGVDTDAKKSAKTNSGSTGNASPSSGFSFVQPAAAVDIAKKPVKTDSGSAAKASTSSGFSFSQSAEGVDSNKPVKTDFGSTEKASTSSGFSFLQSTAATDVNAKKSSGFSFTATATPFSFGNIQPPPVSTAANAEEEDEEDNPPKVEFNQVVEKDAVYSKKCKVFVKKNENFVEKGVGTLYLKPVQDTKKTQMLVRADTNLGNVLVNLILNKALPTKRIGKNNVMLICLPTPDVEKPTSLLLRVKTSEEADELLETIEKHK